ncbi:MAG TPA: hypothetical protein VFZ10_17765 [Geminicoccaceae bacterium]
MAVFGEVKLPHQELSEIARSTEGHDQIGRYLAQTGVVLICSVRAFGLLVARPGYPGTSGIPVPSAERELLATVDLWDATPVKPATVHQLIDIVARSVTDFAPLADPADLAKVLARQARDAKEALPADLRPLAPLLNDFRQALGLSFDVADEKGDRFFRSSLVQTAFYSLFAAWILWDREKYAAPPFDLTRRMRTFASRSLSNSSTTLGTRTYLRHLDLAKHLERAVATLTGSIGSSSAAA